MAKCLSANEKLRYLQLCQSARKIYPEFKLRANMSSPLKWTKTPIKSSLDDFNYETVVSTTGGLLLLVQDVN
jgi:hypothetical protein